MDADATAASEAFISAPHSGVTVLVVPTDEEIEIARQTLETCRRP